jgi:alpha-mannosidase
MIASQRTLADFPLLPRTRFAAPEDYFAKAHEEAAVTPVSTWVGELYLEYHRGVLTSQGRTKRLHRRAERDLVAAEALAGMAALIGGGQPASLEDRWRLLMINQFHDILPGSSITDVYVRTERELAEVVAAAGETAAAALADIADRLSAAGEPGLLIVNPDLNERPVRLESAAPIPGGQAAEAGYVLASSARVPPLGALTGRPAPEASVTVGARWLENGFLRVEVGDDGSLTRVFDKRTNREVLDGRGNQIWAYHDQPRDYDAWDVEEDYQRAGEEVTASAIEVVEAGGQRGALRITRKVRHSTIVQSLRLWANSARIDFATRFEWNDRRILLKARFPLLVRADHATFECAFGVHRRPTHANTSWDAAKFEVAAHRFVDLSEPGYGAALLNDGRYGHHARGAELGLTLLRSPILPDKLADEGVQGLTYALLPHAGDWIAGGVLAEAEDLNRPLFHQAMPGAADASHRFVRVSGPGVALGALKPAEDGDGLILRVYEPAGGRGPIAIEPPAGWRVAGEVSLLEDVIDAPSDAIRPFEARSWRLRRGA